MQSCYCRADEDQIFTTRHRRNELKEWGDDISMGAKSLLDLSGSNAVDVEGGASDPADLIAPSTPMREISHDAPASDADTGDEHEHEEGETRKAVIPARVAEETLQLAASPMVALPAPIRKPAESTSETTPKQVRFSETVMSIPDDAQAQQDEKLPTGPSVDRSGSKKADADPLNLSADCIVSVHRRLCHDWLDDLFTILHFELSTLATSVQAIRTHSTKVRTALMLLF